MPLLIDNFTELFEAALVTPTVPTVRAIVVIAIATTFFFETIFMVLSIGYFLLPITPRHRLLVINYQRFRNKGLFPESKVRVFERVSRV
jgi:hypothetical protein